MNNCDKCGCQLSYGIHNGKTRLIGACSASLCNDCDNEFDKYIKIDNKELWDKLQRENRKIVMLAAKTDGKVATAQEIEQLPEIMERIGNFDGEFGIITRKWLSEKKDPQNQILLLQQKIADYKRLLPAP